MLGPGRHGARLVRLQRGQLVFALADLGARVFGLARVFRRLTLYILRRLERRVCFEACWRVT
jgi:hypothetical protein